MAELGDVLMMKALEDDNGHDTWHARRHCPGV